MPREQAIQDDDRVDYFRGTCSALMAAVQEDSVDVRAYFPWSESPHIVPDCRLKHYTQVSWTTLNGASSRLI